MIIEMRGIRKEFPGGVVACDDVHLEIRGGEILALLGENGAGKTTLMNILSGVVRPTEGEIRVDGKRVEIVDGRTALQHGIGMVHQHFLLAPPLTVGQNVTLGREPGGWFVNRRNVNLEVESFSKKFGLSVNPRQKVEELSVGMQQRVEIVKALYGGAAVLVLDEPTAVLTPQETPQLFAILKDMARSGRAIVFISHKLREVKEIADRIIVLRRGAVVGEVGPDADEAQLASLMVGRTVMLRVDRPKVQAGDAALEVRDICVAGTPGLVNVSFTVRSGEILGIAGVDGNGQLELEQALAGLARPIGGDILLNGRSIYRSQRLRIVERIARIPSDRSRWGIVRDATVAENLHLVDFRRPPCARRGILSRRAMTATALKLMTDFDIRTNGPDQIVRALSGGNQQKLVVAREVSRRASVLIAAQPTRGVDVGATEFVYRQLVELRSEGAAIVLMSADLDEILGLSDRVAVLYEGRIVGQTSQPDREEIGLWMAGVTTSGVHA